MIGIGCDVVLKSPGAAYLHQHRIPWKKINVIFFFKLQTESQRWIPHDPSQNNLTFQNTQLLEHTGSHLKAGP